LFDFGRDGYVIMTTFFLIMYLLSFDDEFCTVCMSCMLLCDALLLVVVKIAWLEVFYGAGSKTLVV